MMLSIKIYKLQSASIRLKLSQLCIDCSHGYSAHPHDQVGQKTLLPKHISFFSAIKGFINENFVWKDISDTNWFYLWQV